MKELNLGIIGKGFVGTAVSRGFENEHVRQWVVDPKLGQESHSISELCFQQVDVAFVCVPTPSYDKLRKVDPTFVYNVLHDLRKHTFEGLVVIKSTITPNYLKEIADHFTNLRIVYNPEFLTEQNAEYDFKNPFSHIIGGDWDDCCYLESVYEKYSQCAMPIMHPVYKTDMVTASLVKYALNSFYATKVTFMNELYRLHEESGAETTWDEFIEMLDADPRMGSSHLRVPGPDGQYGFGGNCFPKDTSALLHYAFTLGVQMGVLETAVNRNVNIRG